MNFCMCVFWGEEDRDASLGMAYLRWYPCILVRPHSYMVLTDFTIHMLSMNLSNPIWDLLCFLFQSDSVPVSAGAP